MDIGSTDWPFNLESIQEVTPPLSQTGRRRERRIKHSFLDPQLPLLFDRFS